MQQQQQQQQGVDFSKKKLNASSVCFFKLKIRAKILRKKISNINLQKKSNKPITSTGINNNNNNTSLLGLRIEVKHLTGKTFYLFYFKYKPVKVVYLNFIIVKNSTSSLIIYAYFYVKIAVNMDQ